MNNFQFSIFDFKFLKFLFGKPKVVIIFGNGGKAVGEAVSKILSSRFKIGNDVLIFEADSKNQEKTEFLIKNSSLPVLVGSGGLEFADLARKLPPFGGLVMNFDDEASKKLKTELEDEESFKKLTFGFQERADFRASDIKSNGGMNFKLNYKGSVVPVWLKNASREEQIYPALAGIATGAILGLNLVEISEALKKL